MRAWCQNRQPARSGSRDAPHPSLGRGSYAALDRAVTPQAPVALLDQAGRVAAFQSVELVQQDGLEADRHRVRIPMCAAERFAHDLVDQAEFEQARCGDCERIRGVLGLFCTFPQNRGAAFRRDHRIGRILEHDGAVANADRERAA
jgi:hypothetical protein